MTARFVSPPARWGLAVAVGLFWAAPAAAVNRATNGSFDNGSEPGTAWAGDTGLPTNVAQDFF